MKMGKITVKNDRTGRDIDFKAYVINLSNFLPEPRSTCIILLVKPNLRRKGGVGGLGSLSALQYKNHAKRYWEMLERKNLSVEERQQLF